jgi:hypothetical protein
MSERSELIIRLSASANAAASRPLQRTANGRADVSEAVA